MTQQILQAKTNHLRVNFEQIQYIADGLAKVRHDIQDDHLDTYDTQVDDMLTQLKHQGVEIELGVDDVPLSQQAEPDQQELQKLKNIIQHTSHMLIESDKDENPVPLDVTKALMNMNYIYTSLFGFED